MRALVLTDYHRLDVVERERPEPGPGEVLLRLCATGICGSDVHGFTGENGRRVPGQVMGHESSDTVASLGVEVLDPSTGDLAERVAELLGGPADLAIDAVGLTPTLADAFAATALGSRIVLVGMGSPRLEVSAFAISTEERTLIGSFTYSAQDFADAAAWVGAHADQVEPLVSRIVGPEEAHASFAALAAGEGPAGKILVRFDQPEPFDQPDQPDASVKSQKEGTPA